MISVILAAGYATRMYPLTKDFPKPLLPVGGVPILTRLMQDIDAIDGVTRHVVVTNHRFYRHFLAWKNDLALVRPIDILDDGTTDQDNRLGAVADLQFAVDVLKLEDDLLVAAGDNVLDFSLKYFTEYFARRQSSLIMCYREEDPAALRRCGIMVPDEDFRVVSMVEKPENPPSQWAVPPFYVIALKDLPLVRHALQTGVSKDAPGSFIAWLCGERPVYAMPMPGKRYDVGDLKGYYELRDAQIPLN